MIFFCLSISASTSYEDPLAKAKEDKARHTRVVNIVQNKNNKRNIIIMTFGRDYWSDLEL